jgi:hypothetical protein
MRRYYSIVAFAALLIFAPGAFADSMTFTDPGSNVWAGVYVNPYTGVDNTNGMVLTLYCDDWNTEFSGNPTWLAAIAPLVPSAFPTDGPAAYAATNFLFGGITSAYDFTLDATNHIKATEVDFTVLSAVAYYRYLEAAYLFGQIQNTTDATTRQQLSAAAWTLFVDGNGDPTHVSQLVGAINSTGYGPAVVADLTAAASAAGTPARPNYQVGSGWHVVTPASGFVMQEFMYDPPPCAGAGEYPPAGNCVGRLRQRPRPALVVGTTEVSLLKRVVSRRGNGLLSRRTVVVFLSRRFSFRWAVGGYLS